MKAQADQAYGPPMRKPLEMFNTTDEPASFLATFSPRAYESRGSEAALVTNFSSSASAARPSLRNSEDGIPVPAADAQVESLPAASHSSSVPASNSFSRMSEAANNPFQLGDWPTPAIDDRVAYTIGDIRQAVHHRLPYDTHLIVHTVSLLAQLGDDRRLRITEKLLRVLYYIKSIEETGRCELVAPTDHDQSDVFRMLGGSDYLCYSHQGMLAVIQAILERAIYEAIPEPGRVYLRENQYIECAEQVELTDWYGQYWAILQRFMDHEILDNLSTWKWDITRLRNLVAHPQSPDQFTPALKRAVRGFLTSTNQDHRVAEIGRLIAEPRTHIDEKERAWEDGLPKTADGLLQLCNETREANNAFVGTVYRDRPVFTQHHRHIRERFEWAYARIETMYFKARDKEMKAGMRRKQAQAKQARSHAVEEGLRASEEKAEALDAADEWRKARAEALARGVDLSSNSDSDESGSRRSHGHESPEDDGNHGDQSSDDDSPSPGDPGTYESEGNDLIQATDESQGGSESQGEDENKRGEGGPSDDAIHDDIGIE